MGILGIHNRTENWKTARYFVPFYKNHAARVALAQKLGEPPNTSANDIQIELFWKGMRDYVSQYDNTKGLEECLAARYSCLFPRLREELKDFPGFQLKWNNSHYSVHSDKEKLFNNLRNTEIDIVLQTPNYLFIGEAKDESTFDAKSEYVLVHQLIRQYVMATILVEHVAEAQNCPKKTVVPFIIGNKIEELESKRQVRFMISQGRLKRCPGKWLNEDNVLSWQDIKDIASV